MASLGQSALSLLLVVVPLPYKWLNACTGSEWHLDKIVLQHCNISKPVVKSFWEIIMIKIVVQKYRMSDSFLKCFLEEKFLFAFIMEIANIHRGGEIMEEA